MFIINNLAGTMLGQSEQTYRFLVIHMLEPYIAARVFSQNLFDCFDISCYYPGVLLFSCAHYAAGTVYSS